MKKGQANIIVTVLVVLLVIVAFLIVYNIVKPLVSKKAGDIQSSYERLQLMNALSVNNWNYNSDGTLNVSVSRDSTSGEITGIRYTINTDQTTCYIEQADILQPLGTITFIVDISGCSGVVQSVSAQPLGIGYVPAGAQTYNCNDAGIRCINSCRILNETGKTYVLQNSVSTTKTCFTITANNIIVDLNGYTIDGDGNSEGDLGVKNWGYNQTTIKNGKITDFGAGISSSGSSGNFNNLIITSNGNFGRFAWIYGISLSGNNNYISNVNISNLKNTGMGGSSYGVFISISNTNTIRDSVMNSNTYGIYLRLGSNNNLNNIITDSNYYGISLVSGSNNTIKLSRACSNNKKDLYCLSSTGNSGTGNRFGLVTVCSNGWPIKNIDYNDCNENVSISRKISGNQVTLDIDTAVLGEGEILMIAEELPVGSRIDSSNIIPTYNDSNILVWLFSSDSYGYIGNFNLDVIPSSITYSVSGSTSVIKGKWALQNTGEEGVIQNG